MLGFLDKFRQPRMKKGLFHVTHGKAGSQWVYAILQQCSVENVITTQENASHFLNAEIRPNKIYPALYVTQEEFSSTKLPEEWRRFVIIRDLRDVLVSLYYSLKTSHPLTSKTVSEIRKTLNELDDIDSGLCYLINEVLNPTATIQESWVKAGTELIRYEDLITHDIEILTPIILDCMDISEQRVKKIITKNRFEKVTGRKRGEENVSAHERKGLPGDWRHCFSDNVKKLFKHKFGDLIIKSGYEVSANW